MAENDITIVTVAYNRPKSLQRLLKSLSKVNYMNDSVRLYISIDRAKEDDYNNLKVKEVADKFEWKFGEKIVDFKKENMGLKEHILLCGDLTKKYDNIIVLEDDIVVSPYMYIYAKQVLEEYKEDNKIAGFGLYSFQRNPMNNLPFYPIQDGSDVYFMQYACSWGQMWTKDKWKEFKNWYEKCDKENFNITNLPPYIGAWKRQSWLKYHIRYVVETDKYFVYPKIGVTTNFSDVGEHNGKSNFAYQCLMYSNENDFKIRFSKLEYTQGVYDAYFENVKMKQILKTDKQVVSDFYGEKNIDSINKDCYLLSTKPYSYEIIKNFDLVMYPYEQNIINEIEGNKLFLYDLSKENTIKKSKMKNENLMMYCYKINNLSRNDIKILIKYCFKDLLSRLKRKIHIIKKKGN